MHGKNERQIQEHWLAALPAAVSATCYLVDKKW
jgi:hypothetical protein